MNDSTVSNQSSSRRITTRNHSGRTVLLTASDQLPNSDSFQLFSLRLRNLHYSINRILTQRIHDLEEENHQLRLENREFHYTNQRLQSWVFELTPEEIHDLVQRVESPIETVRMELKEAEIQLGDLLSWMDEFIQ